MAILSEGKTNWVKIKNEYINGNVSYRKLAEKHGISFSYLQQKARKEKWVLKRKEQQNKISEKVLQKTAENLAEKEANRMARISDAADELLEKIRLATQQIDVYLAKDKRKYTQQVRDKTTGKVLYVDVEEEKVKSVKTDRIDKAGLKQIASALKDLKDIQLVNDEEKVDESPNINISIVAATPDDSESDE